jgi:hypothetical protein
MRFIEDLRSLSEATSSSSTRPEFQAFLSGLIHDIELMGFSDLVTLAVCDAVRSFGDASDQAFVWLSRIAVKYLVLCTLGLDPEVELQLHRKFATWTVCPDTHMIISYLCEGDEGHTQSKSVFESLLAVNVKILVTQAVAEEAAHHASISHTNLEASERMVQLHRSILCAWCRLRSTACADSKKRTERELR